MGVRLLEKKRALYFLRKFHGAGRMLLVGAPSSSEWNNYFTAGYQAQITGKLDANRKLQAVIVDGG